MSHYLTQVGKKHEVLCHHPAPRNLRFLPGVDSILQVPTSEAHDLGIVLDLDTLERLGNTSPYFETCKRLAVIDHHVPHEAPGEIRIVDTHAPATALILTNVLRTFGAIITPEMATCLLTGIVTDTGSFKFRNTTPESLSVAAYLLECGADLNLITEEVFQTKPLAAMRLLGHTLETMQLASNDRIAWGKVSHRDFEWAGATDEDTEGFVNELLSINSVEIAAIMRETRQGRIRCSLRSRGNHDVAEAARTFGGGGHKNAAGCTFDDTLENAEAQLVERLKACLES
jgi:phosphoesterase RecJ-like protein